MKKPTYEELEKRIFELELSGMKDKGIVAKHFTLSPSENCADAMSKLNRFSIGLSVVAPEDNQEVFITRQIKELTNAIGVTFSAYNPDDHALSLRHTELEPGLIGTIANLLGKQLQKMQTAVSDEMYTKITDKIIGKYKTLSEATLGTISGTTGALVQAVLGADRFIGVSYMIEGKLYGTSMLALAKDVPDPPDGILESFAFQAALSLRRKHAEDELKESENKYRELVENSPDAIAIYVEGKIVFANRECARLMSAKSPQELIGMPVLQFVHPDYRDLVINRMKQARENNTVLPLNEEKFVRLDGSEVFVEVKAMPIRIQHKPAVQLIVRDISERKQAELEREVLFEIMQGLTVTRDLNDFLKLVHHSIAKVLYAENFFVVLYNAQSCLFEEVYSVDKFDPPSPPSELENSISSYVFRSGQPLLLSQERFDELVEIGEMKLVGTNSPSWLGVPLKTSDETIGVMVLQDYEQHDRYSKRDTDFLFSIAGQVAQAVGLKRAEDALKQSEAQQRFILESLPLTIYSAPVNPESDTNWISGDVKRITGFENEEYLSSDDFWRSRLHPDDKFTVLEAFEKLPLNKESVLEYRWKCKDGEYHWFHDRAVLLENDSVKEYLGIFLDITDRKRSEEILNQSEEKYRMIIDLAADAFFHGDSKGNLIDVNNSAIELTGYSRDELLKMNMADLFSADYLTQKPLRYDLLVKGQVIKSEREITRKDGRSVFVEMNSKKMPDGNYQSFFRDITRRRQATEELKASEEKFRNIFEANTDGITIFHLIPGGGPSKIIDLNKNAAKMVGYTKEAMLLMKPEDLEIDITTEKIEKRKFDLISKGYSNFETTLLHNDGHEINVEINATIITYNNQSAIMNIVRDITERKQNEVVIKNKNEELRKLNVEKDKFFSIIAHDLRSPFNSFLGLTQIMAEELPNLTMSQLQKIADSMRNSATNLFSLLENLLLWSRMKQGLIPFNPEKVQLWQSVNLSISIVSEPALDKGIEITVNVPDDLQVLADVNMLQTVIRNLVSNAVKFTPKGGKVDILARPSAHNAVEVLISDSGIGMSTGMLHNLFRIDEQTNRTGTEGEPSTGLGLILCKEFVEKHGGKIWAESEEGKGSTFFFTIPCNPEPEK